MPEVQTIRLKLGVVWFMQEGRIVRLHCVGLCLCPVLGCSFLNSCFLGGHFISSLIGCN